MECGIRNPSPLANLSRRTKWQKRLAIESTVSPADTFAVLKSLGSVLGSYMADGRTVKLDGVGTFYYTAVASGNGVDSPDKVTAKQITGVRVRFIPETSRSSNNQVTTRSLVDSNIFWEEWGRKIHYSQRRWRWR